MSEINVTPAASAATTAPAPLVVSRFPLYVWIGAVIFFVANIWLTARQLPQTSTHVYSFLGMGLAMSAFSLLLCYAARWFPADKLNLPNREFWKKPANRPTALSHIFYHGFWLGTLSMVYIGAVYYFIVSASRTENTVFADRGMMGASIFFMSGIVIWCFLLVRFFIKHAPVSKKEAKRQKR